MSGVHLSVASRDSYFKKQTPAKGAKTRIRSPKISIHLSISILLFTRVPPQKPLRCPS